ncbi:thiol-disulfide oxidoreductase DCC family protein [Agaribacterium haliotis]|uniref:thiol-disulfide oxidoreductase DCC family protein n=1 Tax=Agaribacterium haliotis TaxID=2013869 RepID=UPI000BB53736|nr:DUF393 domain-containing protein [Agaribacterium haliotis]
MSLNSDRHVDQIKAELTIFFDSQCPLCAIEINELKKRDTEQKLDFVDIFSKGFASDYKQIDKKQALRILHGLTADGQLLLGLDVSHRAWSLLGNARLTGFLRWRPIRPLSDAAYRFFAKHRYSISALLTGRSRTKKCNTCARPDNRAR